MHDVHSAVIASPHTLEASGIGSVLEGAGWGLLGLVCSQEDLLALLEREHPEVILLDGCLVGEHSSFVRTLSGRGYAVVLMEGPERLGAMFLEGLAAGARGVLSVDEPPEEFLSSVALAIHGTTVIYRGATQSMLEAIVTVAGSHRDAPLTAQQHRIAALIARGASNREVAEGLVISEHTVKVHLSSILGRLGLQNRQQLAVYAVRHGLVAPQSPAGRASGP